MLKLRTNGKHSENTLNNTGHRPRRAAVGPDPRYRVAAAAGGPAAVPGGGRSRRVTIAAAAAGPAAIGPPSSLPSVAVRSKAPGGKGGAAGHRAAQLRALVCG